MLSLRYLFVFTVFLMPGLDAHAQFPSGLRSKKIPASQQVQVLDTLSIVQESFIISGPDDKPLDQVYYNVDYINAIIRLRIPEYWIEDSLLVSYRVFPIMFSAPYFRNDTSLIRAPGPGEEILSVPLDMGRGAPRLIQSETLISSGSITRGITLGNRQDVSLNSAMNLQLSGFLSEDIEVAAVISDQDIPFQPEGTTRQIQDFDKVYIRLSGLGGQLTAGDFDLERPAGYFMNFSRRAQGGMAGYSTHTGVSQDIMPGAKLDVTAAGAIAKGKYTRNQITAIEGNQGPYKLTGAANESYIMVLANSERVFIDGELLVRGMDHDYVIDYNLAEITFTSRRLIRRESRIVAEFEYAERNFARSIFFSGVNIENERAAIRFNFFSEQDHPNQPLFQELSDQRIDRMAQVGDSLHLAFDWNIDSLGFHNDRVMYRLTDSLGIDTVFVYSTDPERAVYRVGFTFVGQGNGNYRQVSSAANGRVFQWIEPEGGLPQGTHEPVIQLVTPKRDQLMTLGADFNIGPGTITGVEFAFSNRDLNLFSNLHKQDNTGYAIRLHAANQRALAGLGDGTWKLNIRGNHEVSGSTFSPLERYRPVEFTRDWNLIHEPAESTEHLSHLELQLLHPGLENVRYSFRSLLRDNYQGIMNSLDGQINVGSNRVFYDGALLNSSGLRQTSFYRHRAGISRPLLFLNAGAEHHFEHNAFFAATGGSLSNESFAFDQWTFYLTNPDTLKNRYRVFYKHRIDRTPDEARFEDFSRAREVGASWDLLKNPDQRFHITAVRRTLTFFQPAAATGQEETSLAGRIDYFSRWGAGLVTSSLFYEAGSAMEREREYIYIEVPAGQGVYVWIDYNENGIMELDEFEVAMFPDQANFIRVFVPTEEMVRVFSNVMSHTLNIDPSVIWRQEQGIKRLIARFSNQMAFRIDRKTQEEISAESFSPFGYSLEDEELISLNASFRNIVYFNRADPVFGAELNYQNNRNKVLLSNGFETRLLQTTGLGTRWNITSEYSLNLRLLYAIRENRSEFFFNRNFRFRHYDAEPMLSYQTDGRYRLSLFAGYAHKHNELSGAETAVISKMGCEVRYNAPGRGTLHGRYQLSDIDYPFNANTPVAFDMLEGLNPGVNHLWNISWQQNLNIWLQLTVTYHGRKPSALNTIHTGNVQLRALF